MEWDGKDNTPLEMILTHCEGIKSWKSLCLLELSYTSHFMTGS